MRGLLLRVFVHTDPGKEISPRPAGALYLQMRALHSPQEEGGLCDHDSFCSTLLLASSGTPVISGLASFL